MEHRYYRIHNLINIRLTPHKKIFDRLRYFETDEIEDIDIDIIVGGFAPPSSLEYKLIDGKYWVGNNSIFCNYRHKLSFWRIWIEGIDQDKTTIHFWGDPWFSSELLLMLIVEPLIAYKLSKRGALVLHASSLSMNGKGFIFTGSTGSGKTTIALKMMNNQNTKYFSDDQAFVKGTTLYSYPLPIGFRKHLVDHCGVKLSNHDYGILRLQKMINTLTLYYPNLTHRVELEDICYENSPHRIQAGEQVPINSIFALSKTIGRPRITKLSPEQAYSQILEHNEGNEDKLAILYRYFTAYKKKYPETNYSARFKQELRKLVNHDINFYNVSFNKRYDFEHVLGEMRDIMERGNYES